MSKPKVVWMTAWSYGEGSAVICSRHTSKPAAIRAAEKCEREGGAPHTIWEVRIHKKEGT